VKRFLITTALEETWSEEDPVLFLGEWCLLNSRKSLWSRMNAEVLPYHWDDRAKMRADYQYLQAFYERLLRDVAAQLNSIHAVNHSVRYWRILIGPWLGYFVQILFDRWASIQQAVSNYEISSTTVLASAEDALVPPDMAGFMPLFVGDRWNHHVYSEVIGRSFGIDCVTKACPFPPTATDVPRPRGLRRIRQPLARGYSRVAGLLARDRDAFFLSTYLPLREEVRLQRRLGQMPQLWRPVRTAPMAVDWARRQWAVPGVAASPYEACTRALVARQIPIAYLEGYAELLEQVSRLPWPKHPKVIWTSNAHISEDVFKAWAAEKVERGAPLVIGQHGGHFGVGQWSFLEDHETAISDAYLSWGWSDANRPNVKPVGQLTVKRPLGIRHSKQKCALLVSCTVPRQSYWMYSAIVSRQWLDYFKDQCTFVEHLPVSIRHALTVRLYRHDWGWDQLGRWRDRFPDVRLDSGHSSIDDLVRGCRLYISTYNATTFLEAFTMDVPSVIYWDPQFWEIRDSAVPYFDDLRRAGIFHESPESAARHVEVVWDDVDTWWGSSAVRDAVNRFKSRYCDRPDHVIDRVEDAIKRVVSSSRRGGAL